MFQKGIVSIAIGIAIGIVIAIIWGTSVRISCSWFLELSISKRRGKQGERKESSS